MSSRWEEPDYWAACPGVHPPSVFVSQVAS